jgi:hypothetical protein
LEVSPELHLYSKRLEEDNPNNSSGLQDTLSIPKLGFVRVAIMTSTVSEDLQA